MSCKRLRDLSVERVLRTDRKEMVHLISYADRNEVNFRNRNYLVYTAINQGIDAFILYCKRHIDEDFRRRNAHILDRSRGAGYWLWKPYIILDTLTRIREGDVVIYLDSGIHLYPADAMIDAFIQRILNDPHDIFLKAGSHVNVPYIKRDALRYFGMDDDQVRNRTQLDGAFIACKSSDTSRAFIRQWLEVCCIARIIDDSKSAKEYPEFIDHRHDQALLTLLYYANENICKTDGFFRCVHHRRRQYHTDVSLLRDLQA